MPKDSGWALFWCFLPSGPRPVISDLIVRDPWERQGLPPYCPHGSLTTKLKVRSFTLLSVYFLRSYLKVPTSPVLNPPLFSFRSSEF